jgi:hypothetical protein
MDAWVMFQLFVPVLLVAGLVWLVLRWMAKDVPRAALDVQRWAFSRAFLILIVALVVGMVGIRGLHDDAWRFVVAGGILLCGMACLGQIAVAMFQRKQAGDMLLDCGTSPTKALYLLLAVAGLLLMLGNGLLVQRDGLDRPEPISGMFLGVVLLVYGLWAAFGHLQFREKGIWSYTDLVPWERIESYRWDHESGRTLFLTIRRRFAFFFPHEFPLVIPADQTRRVDQLLKDRLT